LPRLLRLPLLSAALRLLWPPPAGCPAQAIQPGRGGGCGRGSRAHRRPDPRALAADPHSAARRFRFRPRRADGLVRDQPGRLPLWPGPERPPGQTDLPRDRVGRGGSQAARPAGPALQGPEWLGDKANPRFVVTSLKSSEVTARRLYERLYCARGDMENRIKECQLDLFADRTSTGSMRANQLRLWFASLAYVLLCALRRIGLAHTRFATATCGTLRLRLLKIGALVKTSVRRIKVAMASTYPWQAEWARAHARLTSAAA